MLAFFALTSFLTGMTLCQEDIRESSCMWPWAKHIGTPDNLKGLLEKSCYIDAGDECW